MDEVKIQDPEEGPNGVDRWTSNGYGLRIDGIDVTPEETEAKHGKQTEEYDTDER